MRTVTPYVESWCARAVATPWPMTTERPPTRSSRAMTARRTAWARSLTTVPRRRYARPATTPAGAEVRLASETCADVNGVGGRGRDRVRAQPAGHGGCTGTSKNDGSNGAAHTETS